MKRVFDFFRYIPELKIAHVAYFLLSFLPYSILLLYFKIDKPDLVDHIKFADGLSTAEYLPAHPLFFVAIKALSLFSSNYYWKLFAGFLIFSSSQYFTYHYSLRIIREIFKVDLNILMHILLVALQFAVPIPFISGKIMTETISINYFHNGTMSMSIPIAYAVVLYFFKFLEDENLKYLKYSYYFSIILILTKPSFTFCLIPAIPIYSYIKYGFSNRLLRSLQFSIFLTFCIVGQSFYLRNYTPSYLKTFGMKFMPFFLHGSYLNHLRIVLEGYTIGVAFILLYYNEFLKQTKLIFAFILVFVGYTLSFTMIDYLNGNMFPNLIWQTPIVNKLAIVIILPYFSLVNQKVLDYKQIALAIILLIHALFGLYYLYYVCLLRLFFLSM